MIKNLCYVVRPPKIVLSEWQWVYNVVIQPIAVEQGFKCDLAKVMGDPGTLIDNIILHLVHAELVVIDVTRCDDPRAYYQLGVRHARSNRTILIAKNDSDILSDLKPYNLITYSDAGTEIAKFQARFRELVETIRREPEEPDNPVQHYLNGAGKLLEQNQALEEKLSQLEQTMHENKDLQAKVAELERTMTTLASAPQPPRKTITFTPVPPIR
jgi:hypothetical protein